MKYTNGTSLDYNKLTSSVPKEASLDYSKMTTLKIPHVDTYKDTPKLNEEYIVLLKLKRLSSARYSKYKSKLIRFSLIYIPLQELLLFKFSLTLDKEKLANN